MGLRAIEALASFTHQLHAVPIEGCPFDRSLDVVVPLAGAAVREGTVELDRLDFEHSGWTSRSAAE